MRPSCASSRAGRATSTRGAPLSLASAPTRAPTTSSGRTSKTSCVRARASEELAHLLEAARALHRRLALEDPFAVGPRQQARIAKHEHAAIAFVANQPPRALLLVPHPLTSLEPDKGGGGGFSWERRECMARGLLNRIRPLSTTP